MKALKPFLLVGLSFALILPAVAGQIVFVSSQLLSSPSAFAPPPWSSGGSASASGKNFNANMSFGIVPPSQPIYGTIAQGAVGTAIARFKVKWVEDYPGEPRPSSALGFWTVYQESRRWPHFYSTPGSGSITIGGTAMPNAGQNFNDVFSSASVNSERVTSDTQYEVFNGDFSFGWENTDWIGTAVVEISFSLAFSGSLSIPHYAMPSAGITINSTLTKVGSWTVS